MTMRDGVWADTRELGTGMGATDGAAILAWALLATAAAAALRSRLALALGLAADTRAAAASGRILVLLYATAESTSCGRGLLRVNPRVDPVHP